MRVFIVGGYGTFGGRIVELLENEPRLTLVIAGRSMDKAEAYCRSRGTVGAQLIPAAFDRNGDAAAQLTAFEPDILIDASGPFQAYGARRYTLVEACIARKISYLDLADGSAFVAGIDAFDEAARAAGVFVLSGVSSFPVLTAAVVRRLSETMQHVDSIRGGIAPSPFAGVGENVIRAIAGYAGQPISLRRNGAPVTAYPFTEQMPFTVAPPGLLPLDRRIYSLVDVPDLPMLPQLWPEAKTVWMGAAPVPQILHRALIGLAWLTRWRIVPSLSPLARLMFWATNSIRWGEHRGGMFVKVKGRDTAGASVTRSWNLLAEGDDGPLIPSMAVEAIVRKTLAGTTPTPGARAATKDVELSDYEALFVRRTILTGIRDEVPPDAPVHRKVIGEAWSRLPPELQAMHDLHSDTFAEGRAIVERGISPIARLVAAIFRFPPAGNDVPISVHFRIANGGETWTRNFGGHAFSSHQSAGTGRFERLLCERFGPLTFGIALVLDGDRMRLVLRGWKAFGVPMPRWLCPRVHSYEAVEDGKFRFFMEIGLPIVGLVVRYRGWLERRT